MWTQVTNCVIISRDPNTRCNMHLSDNSENYAAKIWYIPKQVISIWGFLKIFKECLIMGPTIKKWTDHSLAWFCPRIALSPRTVRTPMAGCSLFPINTTRGTCVIVQRYWDRLGKVEFLPFWDRWSSIRFIYWCVYYILNFHSNVTMERSQWMYNTSRLAHSFMKEVTKFVDNAKKHALSGNQKGIICRALIVRTRESG